MMADAARLERTSRLIRGLLILMFLLWWIPLSILGVLAWWSHPLLWLGLVVFCDVARGPARTLMEEAEALRDAEPLDEPDPEFN